MQITIKIFVQNLIYVQIKILKTNKSVKKYAACVIQFYILYLDTFKRFDFDVFAVMGLIRIDLI